MEIKCPKCGTKSTDEDFKNNEERVGYWTDDKGFFNFECWECNYEWKEKVRD